MESTLTNFLYHYSYFAIFLLSFISSMGIPAGSEVAIIGGGALASGEVHKLLHKAGIKPGRTYNARNIAAYTAYDGNRRNYWLWGAGGIAGSNLLANGVLVSLNPVPAANAFENVEIIPGSAAYAFILFDKKTGQFCAYDVKNSGGFPFEKFGTTGRIEKVGAAVQNVP